MKTEAKKRRGRPTKEEGEKKRAQWYMASNEDIELLGGRVKVAGIVTQYVNELVSNVRNAVGKTK